MASTRIPGAERRGGRAGGRLVHSYDAIGVAIASSTSPTFGEAVLRDARVQEAAWTVNAGVQVKTDHGDSNVQVAGG
jgi:hypothetical protein